MSFQIKTRNRYVVGTQKYVVAVVGNEKNSFSETVLLSTQNRCLN